MEKTNAAAGKKVNYIGYTFDQPVNILAGQTSNVSIQINTRDFMCKKIAFSSTGPVLVNFVDNNNVAVFNKPVLASLLFTDAKNNNRPLTFARLIKAKETFSMYVTDVSAAPNAIYCALEGAEVS